MTKLNSVHSWMTSLEIRLIETVFSNTYSNSNAMSRPYAVLDEKNCEKMMPKIFENHNKTAENYICGLSPSSGI